MSSVLGGDEVSGVVHTGMSSEQQLSLVMIGTLSRFFNGSGLVGRSQCFWEKIGMFINAV
jgi:hypothetical protein